MPSPIEKKLTVRQLVQVLKHARGGNIGFDPFRDPRTSTRANLLKFLLESCSNEQIISGISALASETQTDSTSSTEITISTEAPTPTLVTATLTFEDPNMRQQQSQVFPGRTKEEAIAAAHAFLHQYPMFRPLNLTCSDSAVTAKDVAAASEAAVKDKKAWEYRKDLKSNTETAKSPAIPSSSSLQDPAQELAVLLRQLAAQNSKAPLDTEAVMALVRAECQALAEQTGKHLANEIAKLKAPTVVHVLKTETKELKDMGIQHKNFPTLLKAGQARTKDGHKLNIWLKGPAGSGKTTAAKHLAKALELPFQFNGAIATEFDLMGYKDAHGTYHTTAFREIFEKGGVYLFDEVDSSMPKAVLAFNAALANGVCRFPDGMIERHKDCLILAGANTMGDGATNDYARQKQDKAFLDRFVKMLWPLDETLETALASNSDWCARVQRTRAKVSDRSIKGHIISPRATFYGEALLAAGIDLKEVEDMTLKAGLTEESWEEVRCKQASKTKSTEELPF